MQNLTEGKAGSLILKFAIPMLLGNVFMQIYSVINSIVVGLFIGKEALAAVGASFPLIFALVSFIIGIGMGFSIAISQYFGARDITKVTRTIDTMWIFLLVSSIIITVIGLTFSRQLLVLTGIPGDVLPLAIPYFNINIIGFIVLFAFNGGTSALRGLGDSKTPLYFLIISTLVNIALDLLFVLVFKWGIEGTAWATVIAQAGAFCTMAIYLNRTHQIIKINFRRYVFDREIFMKSVKIGLPTGFQQTFVSLGMVALLSIVSQFGTVAVAAYTVATRIDSFASMPAMNFASALSTFVGQNLGAGRADRVRSGMIATLKMTSVISLSVTIIAILFSRQMMGIFTRDPEIIAIGADYLVIVSSFYLFFSAMFVISGVMRGAGDTLIPMFITLLSLWLIRIPVSWLLSDAIGIHGIWWGIPIAWFIGMVGAWFYYKTGRWKLKAIVKHLLTVDAGAK
ncbi:MAG TPA: MATE family efflux transporter [Bacteroidales bacterium]|nr:MAG: MATE family efflux transporter [Bacteroidetes bacterium GWE2_42_24]OFY29251.1 MAG: MATE family efflux transporter [Bacteroidetes bacterium GWF2_43_11]HBZ66759.1 MATE family efflux transporter [Bacteroidales bacterium]